MQQVSINPATTADKSQGPFKLILCAVNRSLILTYKERCLQLNLGLCIIYNHIFIVAHVNNVILRADFFLHKFGLMVNLNSVYGILRQISNHVGWSCLSSYYVVHANQDSTFPRLLGDYSSIIVSYFHEKVLTLDRLKAAKAEFQQLLDQGIICSSNSE